MVVPAVGKPATRRKPARPYQSRVINPHRDLKRVWSDARRDEMSYPNGKVAESLAGATTVDTFSYSRHQKKFDSIAANKMHFSGGLHRNYTNLWLDNLDHTTGNYTETNVSTARTSTAPDLTTNATRVTATGSGNIQHSIDQDIAVTNTTQYVVQTLIRASNASLVFMRASTETTAHAFFDIDHGSVRSIGAGADAAMIRKYVIDDNGTEIIYYRIALVYTATSTTTETYEVGLSTSNGVFTFEQAGEHFDIWGSLRIENAFPVDLIVDTDGVQENKASDTVTIDNTNDEFVEGTEGSITVAFRPWFFHTDKDANIIQIRNTATDELHIRWASGSNDIFFEYHVGGVLQGSTFFDINMVRGKLTIITVTWKASEFKLYVSGELEATDSSGSVTDLGGAGSTVRLGHDSVGSTTAWLDGEMVYLDSRTSVMYADEVRALKDQIIIDEDEIHPDLMFYAPYTDDTSARFSLEGASDVKLIAVDGDGSFVDRDTGFLTQASVNIGRIEEKGLLASHTVTNPLLQNRDLSTTWATTGSTISINDRVSRDGTINADKVVEDGSSGEHRVHQAQSITSGDEHVYSGYVFIGERTHCILRLSNTTVFGTPEPEIHINITNGTIDAEVGAVNNSEIEVLDDGWLFVWMQVTAVATGSSNAIFLLDDGSFTGSYSGDSASGAYFYGGMVEEGKFPTRTIFTTTSQLSRAFDLVQYDNRNGQILNNTSGSIIFAFTPQFAHGEIFSSNRIVDFGITSTTTIQFLYVNNAEAYKVIVFDGGVQQANLFSGLFAVRNETIVMAATYKTNEVKFFIDGAQEGATDVSANIPDVHGTMTVGNRLASSPVLSADGHVAELKTYRRILTAEEIARETYKIQRKMGLL